MAPRTLSNAAGKAGKTTARAAGRATGAATRAGTTAQKKVQEATPTGQLQQSLQNLAVTVAERTLSGVSGKASKTADRLNQYTGGSGNLLSAVTGVEKVAGGASPLKAAMGVGMDKVKHTVQDKFEQAKDSLTGGKSKGSGGKKLKLTNIVEQIDVGVPVHLAYDQWTQFADFPKFMKKVEQVEQVADEKLTFTGKVFWSRRSWEATIIEQVPYERIVWRSKGHKGYIDGAVTFHEITPDLTRIIMVLEYHPNGFFEKTANLWRATGRRARLELKHFERHIMTDAVLHPDDIEGWHGEIHDKEVVKDDETARREEQENAEAEGPDEEAFTDEQPGDEEPRGDTDDAEHAEDAQDQDTDQDRDTDEEPEPSRRRPAARRRTTVKRRTRERRGAQA